MQAQGQPQPQYVVVDNSRARTAIGMISPYTEDDNFGEWYRKFESVTALMALKENETYDALIALAGSDRAMRVAMEGGRNVTRGGSTNNSLVIKGIGETL
jgi:hypothetical protein